MSVAQFFFMCAIPLGLCMVLFVMLFNALLRISKLEAQLRLQVQINDEANKFFKKQLENNKHYNHRMDLQSDRITEVNKRVSGWSQMFEVTLQDRKS